MRISPKTEVALLKLHHAGFRLAAARAWLAMTRKLNFLAPNAEREFERAYGIYSVAAAEWELCKDRDGTP